MKVLWFSNTPAAGDEYISSNGTGGWMKSLDKAIQDKVELHVVFRNPGYPSEFKVGSTYYHCVSAKRNRVKDKIRRLLGQDPETERCVEIIESVKPDIIHIHGTETSWIRIVEYIDGIPVILSVQAIVTVMIHKFFSGIQKKDLPILSSYRKQPDYYLQKSSDEVKLTPHIPYLLGRTEWDRRCYSVIAPNAQYFVSNEILRDGFYETIWDEPNRSDGKLIVHSTTGEHLFKGLETICQAVTLLNNMGVNIEWRVAGVRENSEFVKIVKHKLKRQYPIKGLKLLGNVKEEDLIDYMLEAHIYVSPSHQDNSPNALCEATLIGMPCISTYAGGSGTILKDGITGVLIQDGDPWGMAGAVLELARNRKLAIKYASAARNEALVRHDKKTIVENLLNIYHEVISNR